MFEDIHYVPILRSKKAEFDALRHIHTDDRRTMMPLIQVVPDSIIGRQAISLRNIDDGFNRIADKISSCWCGYPILIDVSYLTGEQFALGYEHPLTCLWRHIRQCDPMFPQFGPVAIPVATLNLAPQHEVAISRIIQEGTMQLCLRLSADEVSRPTFWREIQTFLTRMCLRPASIHLLVDYGYIKQDSIPVIAQVCSRLPYLDEWLTFTVAAGSFPKNLMQFAPVDEYPLPRLEWCMWRDQVIADFSPHRRPGFGDYGIYHL